MHILTVLDQPDPKSFSRAVAERFMQGAQKAGHTTEFADLHTEGFNPVWRMEDFAQMDGKPMPDDVLAEQARIERADALALVFPLWWWGMPAMMKGWVDRVFSWGWAYDQIDDPSPEASLLGPRPCVMLVPAGASPQEMEKHGYDKAMQAQWLMGTLGYMGMVDSKLIVMHGSTGKAFRREQHLETAFKAGQEVSMV